MHTFPQDIAFVEKDFTKLMENVPSVNNRAKNIIINLENVKIFVGVMHPTTILMGDAIAMMITMSCSME